MTIRLTASLGNQVPAVRCLADVLVLETRLLFLKVLANLVLHCGASDSVDYADTPAFVQDE